MPRVPQIPYVSDCFKSHQQRQKDALRDRMLHQAYSDRANRHTEEQACWTGAEQALDRAARQAHPSSRRSSSTTDHQQLMPQPLRLRRAGTTTARTEQRLGTSYATYAERDAGRRPSHSGRIHYNAPPRTATSPRRRPSQRPRQGPQPLHHSRLTSRQISPALQDYGAEDPRYRRTGGGGRFASRPPQPVNFSWPYSMRYAGSGDRRDGYLVL